ncbi:DUF1534 domain-containing protein [Pseudomonas syringae]|nr:DUF1534 domain-containing protein [Pseudomonas syringae]MCF5205948.1 DUF1534 domain-containing protein [Pseudomonas syringae]MCF5273282.1 DUF1534 domain-containing protein [Pseudomonas syringae]MCF5277529.1 DUF1534 domain-containing protein [Pseudomonas syringae]MCF5284204.1 DUF1534 domain-containing protein [Pseudomonas syringae]
MAKDNAFAAVWARWCLSGDLSLRTLQRENAVRDALRHTRCRATRSTLRLLAKRPVQPRKSGHLNHCLREQARSHRDFYNAELRSEIPPQGQDVAARFAVDVGAVGGDRGGVVLAVEQVFGVE